MGSITKGPYDPTSTAPVDTLLGNSTAGCIIVHNLSQYELYVTTPDAAMTSFVAAWGWRRFDAVDPTPLVSWSIAATPAQTNPPLSVVFVESFEDRQHAPPQYFGQYVRQTSVGSTLSTTQLFPTNDNVHFLTLLWDSVNKQLDIEPNNTSQVGQLTVGWRFFCMDPAGNGRQALSLDGSVNPPATTIFGPVAGVDGEAAAAGALGVPLVDGLTQAQHITTSGLQTILSVTPAVTGLYRLSGIARVNNGVTPNNVNFKVQYTDPDAGGATGISFLSALSGAFMTGASGIANGAHAIVPLTLRVQGGTALTVSYNDPTNTPSDFVSAFLERIA